MAPPLQSPVFLVPNRVNCSPKLQAPSMSNPSPVSSPRLVPCTYSSERPSIQSTTRVMKDQVAAVSCGPRTDLEVSRGFCRTTRPLGSTHNQASISANADVEKIGMLVVVLTTAAAPVIPVQDTSSQSRSLSYSQRYILYLIINTHRLHPCP